MAALSLLMPTHLGESCDPVPHIWENGGLVAYLKVKIDGLVGEGGKLVTEAKLIHALDLSLVREAVVLLLGFPVDGVPQGVLHIAVNVVVASRDDLTTTKATQSAVTTGQPHSLHANQAVFRLHRQALVFHSTSQPSRAGATPDSEAERSRHLATVSLLERDRLRFERISAGLGSFCSANEPRSPHFTGRNTEVCS